VVISNDSAILAAQAINRQGLTLPELSAEVVKALTKKYPSLEVTNPLNLGADADAERYEVVFKRALADPNVDGAMVINATRGYLLKPEDVRIIAEVAKKVKDKPVVDVAPGGEDWMLVRDMLKDTNLPTYDAPEKAAKALRALYLYGRIRAKTPK
jgi:acyl-CoA synthetase (NDP forming)